MKLKKTFVNDFPLVNYFIEAFNSGKISREMLHKHVIQNVKSLEDFDSQVNLLNLEIIDFENKNFNENQKDFTSLNKFILSERNNLMKHFKKPVRNNFISRVQKRVVRLTDHAFAKTGNNKPNIKENKNEYSLIF